LVVAAGHLEDGGSGIYKDNCSRIYDGGGTASSPLCGGTTFSTRPDVATTSSRATVGRPLTSPMHRSVRAGSRDRLPGSATAWWLRQQCCGAGGGDGQPVGLVVPCQWVIYLFWKIVCRASLYSQHTLAECVTEGSRQTLCHEERGLCRARLIAKCRFPVE
jgi:hypothetical protein